MDYVILTYTGFHYFISRDQERKLRTLGQGDEMEINGNVVKMRNISDIVTLDKYYERFPDRKPEQRSIFSTEEKWIPRTKQKKIRVLDQILKGFNKHFSRDTDRELPPPSMALRRRMEDRIEVARTLPEDHIDNENLLTYF